MPLDEPSWWYREHPGPIATGLSPIAALYGWAAQARFSLVDPYRSRLPVLCAGNFTAGGSGKTPLTRYLCECVQSLGKRPVVLSRGYGGHIQGPHWVKEGDQASDTGDEPLLLSETAPVVIARNRAYGARAIEVTANADVIVMDDGLQNPQLHKDFVIAVVDGSRGFGNGRIIPAGPLRAPLNFQLTLANAIVVNYVMSGAKDEIGRWLEANFKGPVLRSTTVPAEDAGWLNGRPVVAWAGIAGPTRFFELLGALGADIVGRFIFRDHASPTPEQGIRILQAAQKARATLVSTEKDLVRLLGHDGVLAELATATRALPIRHAFDAKDAERLAALVSATIR